MDGFRFVKYLTPLNSLFFIFFLKPDVFILISSLSILVNASDIPGFSSRDVADGLDIFLFYPEWNLFRAYQAGSPRFQDESLLSHRVPDYPVAIICDGLLCENQNCQRTEFLFSFIAKIKEKKMANKNFIAVIVPLVCLLVPLIVLSGCSTTHSIVFSTSSQPAAGEYKYAVFSATAFGNATGTVLQRFYKQYPADHYEVIACEAQSKDYLPLLAGFSGALLGALIAVPIAYTADDAYAGMGIAVAGVGASVSLGVFIGEVFKTKYVVTYIERQQAPSE
jgi:hypothetical protein